MKYRCIKKCYYNYRIWDPNNPNRNVMNCDPLQMNPKFLGKYFVPIDEAPEIPERDDFKPQSMKELTIEMGLDKEPVLKNHAPMPSADFKKKAGRPARNKS